VPGSGTPAGGSQPPPVVPMQLTGPFGPLAKTSNGDPTAPAVKKKLSSEPFPNGFAPLPPSSKYANECSGPLP